MNIAGWFVLGLLIFGVVFIFLMMLNDHIKIQKQMKLHEDMERTLHDMNIWLYYDRVLGVEFNPFTCNKIFIRIFESRDGYTKFEKSVYSQSYNRADKHEGTYTDVMKSMDLYNLLKARNAKLIKDYNNKQ
jgi:capsular polysaccharide biosynthesis protein